MKILIENLDKSKVLFRIFAQWSIKIHLKQGGDIDMRIVRNIVSSISNIKTNSTKVHLSIICIVEYIYSFKAGW